MPQPPSHVLISSAYPGETCGWGAGACVVWARGQWPQAITLHPALPAAPSPAYSSAQSPAAPSHHPLAHRYHPVCGDDARLDVVHRTPLLLVRPHALLRRVLQGSGGRWPHPGFAGCALQAVLTEGCRAAACTSAALEGCMQSPG